MMGNEKREWCVFQVGHQIIIKVVMLPNSLR